MSLSQPMASICFFSSSERYLPAIFFSQSAGISAFSIASRSDSNPLNVAPNTWSKRSRLRSSFTRIVRAK